jgi:DNA-binding SARP family transcriptional activator/TolB-like protein
MRNEGTQLDNSARSDVPRLSLEMFGKFSARLDGVETQIGSRKSRALLAFLALSDVSEQTRERLVGLLWSESEEGKARASLRQALHEIRDAFHKMGFAGLHTEKLQITLDASTVSVDLIDVLHAAEQGCAHTLLHTRERLLDTLLEPLETVDPAFRVWLVAKRQSLHDRIVRLLESALRRPDIGPPEGMNLAEAILKLDPTHEEAARTLIRLHMRQGDIGAAMRVYKTLWDLLEQEYDVEPSKETLDLIAAIRMAQPTALLQAPEQTKSADRPADTVSTDPQTPPTPVASLQALMETPHSSRPARLVVSIGGFDVEGIDSDQRHVVQGFRRELIACLVRFREWLVRDQPGLVPRSMTERTDEYVLEASAYQTEGAIRLVLTLRECITNIYLWSERQQIALSNWSNAQQTIVRRIATALNVHVSAGRMALIAPAQNIDLQAYDLWLRGQAHFLTYEPAGWQTASDIFREIIANSPDFAPAHSSLAQLQNTIHFVHPGVFRDHSRTESALSYAREATRLDPIDSRGQLCLGWANAMSGRHEQADIHHRLAYELNENDPWTLVSAALGSAFRGDAKQALELADHALDLSLTPSPAHWRYQAMLRYMCEQYDRSLEAAERAEASIANIYVWKAAALQRLGERAQAKAAADHFFEAISAKWFGAEQNTRENIARWFLHAFPIKSQEHWERLRDDFSGAGAPVRGLKYDAW